MDPVTHEGEKLMVALELTRLCTGNSGAPDGRVKSLFEMFYKSVDSVSTKEIPSISQL